MAFSLRAGLLLLLLPQSGETDTGNLDDLETDTGNITLGLALATETSEKNLVVLVDEVKTTVVGNCKRKEIETHVRICDADTCRNNQNEADSSMRESNRTRGRGV